MTSIKAVRELIEKAIHNCDDWDIVRLYTIEKDLEALEILKKYLYYDYKNHFIKMKSFKKSVFNFDYENLKEWLENAK